MTVRSLALRALLVALAACGAPPAKKPVVAKQRPTTPASVQRVRDAYAAFRASTGGVADFQALAGVVDAERGSLPKIGEAEADLVVAAAAARVIGARLEDAAGDPEGSVALALLPALYGTRVLDGETAGQFRDRLCDGPARAACENVLPEHWDRALTYDAAVHADASAAAAASGCDPCQERYAEELAAIRDVAERAVARREAERPGWGLQADTLPRSAFGVVEVEPAPLGAVTLDAAGAVTLGGETYALRDKKRAAAAEAALRAARGAEGEQAFLDVTAPAAAPAAAVAQLGQLAARGGYTGLYLHVRQAAPPHYRGRLQVYLFRGKAPAGMKVTKIDRRGTVQSYVDELDAVFGAAEGAEAALVVPK